MSSTAQIIRFWPCCALVSSCLFVGSANAGAPPLEANGGVPGKFLVTSTFTDEDGDGKYDKLVTELRDKDKSGQLILKTTDIDPNNDGKAEKSISEYWPPGAPGGLPVYTLTRERGAADQGWAQETAVTDQNQNGKPEKIEEFTSVAHNGKFDKKVTKTDANENKIFEQVETLTAPFGKSTFEIKTVEAFDDTTGKSLQSTWEKGSFGNTPEAQEKPRVLQQPTEKVEGRTVGEGLVQALPDGGLAFHGFLADGLGLTTKPLNDPAMLSAFSFTTPASSPAGAPASASKLFTLTTTEGGVLLEGMASLRSVYGAGPDSDIHLDPSTDLAFIADFDLDTLKLAGVSQTSRFYDPLLPQIDSPFIATLADLLGDPSTELEFRFEPFDPLFFPVGGSTNAALVAGIAQLQVVPEPPASLLLISALILLALVQPYRRQLFRRRRQGHLGDDEQHQRPCASPGRHQPVCH